MGIWANNMSEQFTKEEIKIDKSSILFVKTLKLGSTFY